MKQLFFRYKDRTFVDWTKIRSFIGHRLIINPNLECDQYKLALILIFVISVIYFMVRMPGLTLQPIFADEAIYIRWAQVMRAEPTLRFLPQSDGKTPLFMWTMIPLFKIFPDPLFAGRFLSVISGYFTLLGVLFLGWKFLNIKAGLFSAFLMAITPFIVFFDRMALVDSMLAAFSIWSLNFGLLLIKYQRLDLAMGLGYLLGGGLLTKTPGMLTILSLPITLFVFNWREYHHDRKLLKILALWIVAIGITFALYNILRLGPGFNNLTSRNQDYVFAPSELAGRPLDPFIPHAKDLMDILPKLLTWPILMLIFGGILLIARKRNKFALAILTWSAVPLLIEMTFLKTFTARYILFSIGPLLCLAGWAIATLIGLLKRKQLVFTAVIVVITILPGLFLYRLLTNNAQGLLPKSESGYWRSWTAGYGLKEIADFLNERSRTAPIIVGTQGSFGTLPDGLQIYLDKNRQVAIVGGGSTISEELRQAVKDHQVYFVANRSYSVGTEKGLTLIKDYPKVSVDGQAKEAIFLFRVQDVD